MKAIELHFPITITCPFCEGKGWIEEEHYTLYGSYESLRIEEVECGECEGRGYIVVNSMEKLEEIAAEADYDIEELLDLT